MTIEERVTELERKVTELADVRAERDHWIGEAKKYQQLYRSANEGKMRYFKRLKEEGLL